MTRIHYFGDINPEHGGYFYERANLKRGFGYANVVRIQCGSDAGLGANEFWIDRITVNVPECAEKLDSALSCLGTDRDHLKTLTPAARDALLIDACLSYGYYDIEQSETVRIGKPDKYASETMKDVDIQLRGGSCIGRYARTQAREHCI